LQILARIVIASADTLEGLDLQGNEFDMGVPGALQDWELFLLSFKNCSKMRKVDFSENKLGDKGIETLVRVYTREVQDPGVGEEAGVGSMFEATLSKLSVNSQHEEELQAEDETMEDEEDIARLPSNGSLAPPAFIKSTRRGSEDLISVATRGLRSIAYIRLNNVGMTDLSALNLTYLIPCHALPHILLYRFDSQILDSAIVDNEDELYEKGTLCRGIMYDIEMEEFTSLGRKILEQVEKVRRAGGLQPTIYKSQVPISPTTTYPSSVPPSPDSFRARRYSDSTSSKGYFPETPSPSRKESISSIRTTSTLISHGRSGSIISLTNSKPVDVIASWNEVLKSRPKIQGEILKTSGSVHICQLWTAGIKLLSLARIFTLPAKPTAPHKRSTSPRTPKKATVKITLPPTPVSPRLSPLTRLPTVKRSSYVGQLDQKIWTKILVQVADPEGALSERQALHIVEWAADRTTLHKERECAGKLLHVQMWKLLEVPLHATCAYSATSDE